MADFPPITPRVDRDSRPRRHHRLPAAVGAHSPPNCGLGALHVDRRLEPGGEWRAGVPAFRPRRGPVGTAYPFEPGRITNLDVSSVRRTTPTSRVPRSRGCSCRRSHVRPREPGWRPRLRPDHGTLNGFDPAVMSDDRRAFDEPCASSSWTNAWRRGSGQTRIRSAAASTSHSWADRTHSPSLGPIRRGCTSSAWSVRSSSKSCSKASTAGLARTTFLTRSVPFMRESTRLLRPVGHWEGRCRCRPELGLSLRRGQVGFGPSRLMVREARLNALLNETRHQRRSSKNRTAGLSA
jgi:hypothetical protein